jgi:ferredoxin-NADP reductase
MTSASDTDMHDTDTEHELDLVVARRREEAAGVVSLELRAADGSPRPPWSPGAHLELELGPGLRRHYSICSDQAEPDAWRIAVLRDAEGRGGSRLIHDQVTEGQLFCARGPRNHFPLVPSPGALRPQGSGLSRAHG